MTQGTRGRKSMGLKMVSVHFGHKTELAWMIEKLGRAYGVILRSVVGTVFIGI